MSCCAYLPEIEDRDVLSTAFDIYTRQQQYPDAMRIALKMNDMVRTGCAIRWFLSPLHPFPEETFSKGMPFPQMHSTSLSVDRSACLKNNDPLSA